MTVSEQLIERFYEWEQRGRGYHLFDESIDIEPPFLPFYGHYLPHVPVADDTRKRQWFLRIFDRFRPQPKPFMVEEIDILSVEARAVEVDHKLCALAIALPRGTDGDFDDMRHLLLMLSDTEFPISFEIIAESDSITIQLVCREPDVEMVRTQIEAYFPNVRIWNAEPDLTDTIEETNALYFVELALQDEFMIPVRMLERNDSDPFIGLFAALDQLRRKEKGIIQVLFKGTPSPWSESVIRAVSNDESKAFFVNAPDMPKAAKQKISLPLFAVCIRVVGGAQTEERAKNIASSLCSILERMSASGQNTLGVLSADGRTLGNFAEDIILRRSHRLGMLLNSAELAMFVHLPSSEVATRKIERDIRKTKEVPQQYTRHEFILGKNEHRNISTNVSVPHPFRLKHTHLIGATGTGKSTLLLSMICQDMELGNGIAVLDPHGDLIETILTHVPNHRLKDVLVIDPSDADYPVGFNILSAHSEVEKEILSSDLIATFKRLSSSWGDQMNSVFANAILAILEHKDGGTLMDLRRFLVEKSFREAYLKGVSDSNIVYYWQNEYPLLRGGSIGSILTRLDTFLRPRLIRNMVAQKKGLDFEDILNNRKILLIKLSQGLIGVENSYLLGTFFVSKIYQTAFSRQVQNQSERTNFFFYIDEFHHFVTPSMSHILSGARKYHLGLILAHQDMQQLQRFDSELASSVVVNAGTRICFRLGDVDAKRFASGLSYFDAQDLENLHTGEAIVRIEQPAFDFSMTTIPLRKQPDTIAASKPEMIIRMSREKYGTSRTEIEELLQQQNTITRDNNKSTEEAPLQERLPEQSNERAEVISVTEQDSLEPVIPIKPERIKKTETQHRYLQTLVKRMAESRGYKAIIENETRDGKGRVDVSLERGSERIACEITVTTTDNWETHNVEKCLSDGYQSVIVCSNDSKHLERIKTRLANALNPEIQTKVHAFLTEEMIRYFDQKIAEESEKEKVIKGYKVTVEYDTSTQEETNRKSDNILKAVTNSIRKRKVS